MSLWQERNWTPMLLSEENKPFDNSDFLYELKFDGIRAIIYASKEEFLIKSRNNKDITSLFPELKSIQSFVKEKVIFDGEIVLMDNFLPSFEKVLKRTSLKKEEHIKRESINNPVVFIAFDILHKNKDLINETLSKRKLILDEYPDTFEFVKSKVIMKDGIKLYKIAKKLKMEGIIAKNKDSKYEVSERSTSWIKIKHFQTESFFICGYIDKENSPVLSLILGKYQQDQLIHVGNVSISKKRELAREVQKQSKLKESSIKNFSKKDVIYLKPTLCCKVKFLNYTQNKHLRQPFIP